MASNSPERDTSLQPWCSSHDLPPTQVNRWRTVQSSHQRGAYDPSEVRLSRRASTYESSSNGGSQNAGQANVPVEVERIRGHRLTPTPCRDFSASISTLPHVGRQGSTAIGTIWRSWRGAAGMWISSLPRRLPDGHDAETVLGASLCSGIDCGNRPPLDVGRAEHPRVASEPRLELRVLCCDGVRSRPHPADSGRHLGLVPAAPGWNRRSDGSEAVSSPVALRDP